MEITGIADTVALITGAAGGMGSCISQTLGASGARIALADVAASVHEVATELRHKGILAQSWQLDVTKAAQVQSVVVDIEEQLGPIGILVNAAGVLGRNDRLLQQTADDWDRIFSTNVKGPFLCSRAVAEFMTLRRRGCIVTIASNSAEILKVNQALYGASKAAAQYLTNCLGLELARYGVRCIVVNPGTTETAMVPPGRRERLLNGDLENYRTGIPLRQLAHPTDIARAVLFLTSDQANHITCTSVTIDGGASIRPS